MSALSEEKAREELKKLKPGPAQPRAKPPEREEKAFEKGPQEVQPGLEAAVRAAETPIGGRPPLLRVLPKPPLAKPQLAPRKLKEELRAPEPLRPALVRIEGRVRAELTLKPLRVQPLSAQKPGEVRVLVREPPKEKIALTPKSLKTATPKLEPVSRPPVKQPKTIQVSLQPRIPKPVVAETTVSAKTVTEVVRAEGEAKEGPSGKEIPDFLEILFGSEGGKIKGRGSKIILFKDIENDSYTNFLENICARIYREVEGGEPKIIPVTKLDEWNRARLEEWMSAGGRIFTIYLDNIDNKKLDEVNWRERLEEASNEFVFIIFVTRNWKHFESMKRKLQEINIECQGKLNIIFLEARELPLELVKLASGMLDLPTLPPVKVVISGVPSVTTFDYFFNEMLFRENSAFNRALREAMEEERGLFKSATARAENESDLHYAIKVFVVRLLVEELRKKGLALRTREEIESIVKTEAREGRGIPDIQIAGASEVYEVETLFGEGEFADKKFDDTIKKYPNNVKVNIIIDNFGFLLHLKDIMRVKKDYRNVEFYTLDLKNRRLVSLEEFKKELDKVLTKMASS